MMKVTKLTVEERLRMAAEAGVTMSHYTNTDNPVDFPEQIKAGAEIHAGDGGYSLGTQAAYEEFVKKRNK